MYPVKRLRRVLISSFIFQLGNSTKHQSQHTIYVPNYFFTPVTTINFKEYSETQIENQLQILKQKWLHIRNSGKGYHTVLAVLNKIIAQLRQIYAHNAKRAQQLHPSSSSYQMKIRKKKW